MSNEYKLYFVVTSNSALQLIKKTKAKNILISFYYLKKDRKLQKAILEETDMNILIDSGLFSFFSLLKDKITDSEIDKYCEEYRNVLEKYKDKYLVEDSHWGDYFAGALLDERSGKYRGVNCCGRVIMRVRNEKDEIMGEK